MSAYSFAEQNTVEFATSVLMDLIIVRHHVEFKHNDIL